MKKFSVLGLWLLLIVSPALAQNATKVIIVGNGGGAATVTGGKLDVNVSLTPSGTQDVSVTKWGGTATTLGQKAMAASVPVVIASDQSAVPVSATDGADVAEGAKADAAYAGSGSASVISTLKGIYASVNGAIPAGTAIIGKVGIDQTTPGTTNGVQVNAALPAGSNVIGHVIADTGSTTAATQATASNLNATVVGTGTFAVQAQQTPVTSGGLSWYFVQPAASDNHVVIKAGAGQVYHIAATNNSATLNYIRLYNATTGFNGCNSATNIVGQWAVPASTSGAGLVADIAQGIAFATGISICVTSGYATTDTTNATASAMSVNIGYK